MATEHREEDVERLLSHLMTVGTTSAVKRMQREAVAWEAKRPSTEKTVMAVSLRSGGRKTRKRGLNGHTSSVDFRQNLTANTENRKQPST